MRVANAKCKVLDGIDAYINISKENWHKDEYNVEILIYDEFLICG